MNAVLWISILGLTFGVIESHDDGQTLCTYSMSSLHFKNNHTSASYVDANNTQHCSKSTDACFILWQEDPKNKSITVLTQGCWDGSNQNCRKNECMAVKRSSETPNTSFCCCTGNFCNRNITPGYVMDATDWSTKNTNAESRDDGQALCTYSISPLHVKQHNHTSGNYVDGNNTQHCSRVTDACFILWQEDPKNKSITIFTQGCWDGGDPNCRKNECIAVKRPSKTRNTSFCCCTGNFCNINITEGYLMDVTDSYPEDPARETVPYMSFTMQIVITVVGTVSVFCLGVFAYFFSRVCLANTKRSNESLHLIEAPPPPPPSFDLDTLKIQKESIGQGGFGSVYCGSLNDRTVAVKIFQYTHRQYFFNERDIYTLPHMKHPSIPEYIGYQDRPGANERLEYLLVLSYCPLGCLQNYLKERTVDWSQLCKMSLSIACGLAHLHTEIMKDDKLKHCIAHRDLSSRNILMKADGTCMLCDFGFALQVSGSKYFVNGVEGQAEADSLTEVGTLRYKAPELLEGSVNLRDLESSLKQIDIYALGLILWEIATRCSELYQGLEVPSYKLPFEAEVGAHATADKIKNIVVMRKTRPLFPDIWKATNPAIKSLKETIEDCWDQDAEARLTALCVEERLSELPELWKRYKAELCGPGGLLPSPTLNSNLHKSYSSSKKLTNEINIDCCDNEQLICPRDRSNSLSECTTETLLSPSAEVMCKNMINSNSSPVQVTVPLQPFQGRNPCLARNLMQQQSDDLPIIANSLKDCQSKYPINKKFYSFSDGDTVLSVPSVGIENGLLTSVNRKCNPIPYVQNQVSTIPKKTNMTGTNVSKDFWNKIAGLLVSLNNKTSSNNCNLPEEQQLLKSSAISSPISPTDIDGKEGQINPVNSFWSCSDIKSNNDFTVNPNKTNKPNDSIPIAKLLPSISVNNMNEENFQSDPFCNESFDDEKELKNSNILSSLVSDECIENSDKSKRPTTLPVQSLKNGLDVDIDFLEASDVDISNEIVNDPEPIYEKGKVVRRGSGNRRKGVKRVQTPYEITGRFSLIDDRIMSSQNLPTADETNGIQSRYENVKSSASVPNMNTICSADTKNKLQLIKKDETELKEIPKEKPLNGLIVPVSHNGLQNVLIV